MGKTLSFVSLILGIAALCISYIRCEPLTIEWMGILVGVLSFLVTIVLGWNIYTYVDMRSEWKSHKQEMDKKVADLDSLIKETRVNNAKSIVEVIDTSSIMAYSIDDINAALAISTLKAKYLKDALLDDKATYIKQEEEFITEIIENYKENGGLKAETIEHYVSAHEEFPSFSSIVQELRNILQGIKA